MVQPVIGEFAGINVRIVTLSPVRIKGLPVRAFDESVVLIADDGYVHEPDIVCGIAAEHKNGRIYLESDGIIQRP